MKIPDAVRRLYQSLEDDLRLLERYTNDILGRFAGANRWFYESRVKSLESFALKLETGRVPDGAQMEDLFAATVVVLNPSQVEATALRLQSELSLQLQSRRPESASRTRKYPGSFQFDDLRLYLKHSQPTGLPPRPFLDRVFELQVKTWMQHAWSVATHDVLYKGPKVSWGRERIGFQARAILEHVENAITALELYEQVINFPEYEPYARQNQILGFFAERWETGRLPADRRRLASNIVDLIQALGLTVDDLIASLTDAAGRGEGYAALNLTPYQATVLALFDSNPAAFSRLSPKKPFRLMLTPDLLESRPRLADIPPALVVMLGA